MVFPVLRFPDRPALSLAAPRVVGALNVTPDSFWEGGRFTRMESAVAAARAMAMAGAAVIDIGGESTRPGAARVSVAEQIDRVVPVIKAVRAMLDAPPRKSPRKPPRKLPRKGRDLQVQNFRGW